MTQRTAPTGKGIYLMVVICCCGLVAATLGIPGNATGVFLAPMAEGLQVGIGDISVHNTIVSLVSSLTAILCVEISQRTKKIRPILITGALLGAIGGFGYSISTKLWQLNLFAVCVGLSTGAMGSSFVSMIIGNWFESHRGTVLGLSLCFSGISGAVFSPIFQSLISSNGWRAAYRVNALLTFIAVIPAMIFLKHNPGQLSLPPLGGEETAEITAESTKKQALTLTRGETICGLLMALLSALVVGSVSLTSNLSNFAVSLGLTAEQGAYLISATMVGNLTFKLGGGILIDTLGIRKTSLLVLSIAGLSAVGLRAGAMLPYPALLVFCFLFGSFYCMCGVGLSNLSAHLFGKEKTARMYSYFSAAGTFGGAAFGLAVGYSYDCFQSYMPAVTGIIVSVAICILAVLAAFRIYDRNKQNT